MFYQGIADLRKRRLLPSAKSLARVSTACLARVAGQEVGVHTFGASAFGLQQPDAADRYAPESCCRDGPAMDTPAGLIFVKMYRMSVVT
jgi:hypothetical protein